MNENIVIDSSLRTVEWKDNKVIMIEQTKLPNESNLLINISVFVLELVARL